MDEIAKSMVVGFWRKVGSRHMVNIVNVAGNSSQDSFEGRIAEVYGVFPRARTVKSKLSVHAAARNLGLNSDVLIGIAD